MTARVGRRRRWAAVGVAAVAAITALVSGAGGAAASPVSAAAFQPPKIGHVWTIIFENKSYEATFSGLNQNSYLWRTLPSYGELLRQYYGTGHFSLDNYLSLVGGQSPAPDNQADCPIYADVRPGFPAPDGQTYASTGCVYPHSVRTLFNQLDRVHKSWKIYAQDMGNDPAREEVYHCGIPGDPAGTGVVDPGSATPTDQYVAKHNPAAFFHRVFDSPADCRNVVPLDGLKAIPGHPRIPSLDADLKSVATTPEFSWITPNNCSNAHDATCVGPNGTGNPHDHQGGLFAADLFLKKWIPQIMASPAFQKDGEIQIVFDEAFPPYKMYGNSIADYMGNSNPALNVPTDTAQSVVACCNELPGPNTTQPGDQAFGQDTTPGGGITGAVFISRFIKPGSISDQPYNHYSWLRSMENLFGIATGGVDGRGHLGYAGADGLRPFGPDVYNNPTGQALEPAPSGSSVYPATGSINTTSTPKVEHASVPVPAGGH
jgi:phosphatidylinositol-3-phosphatase